MSELTLDQVKQVLRTTLTQLQDRENELKADLRTLIIEKKRIGTALNILEGERKNGASKKAVVQKPSQATIDRILGVMNAEGVVDRDWTTTQLSEAVGIHSSTVGKAMAWLREQNIIRATRSVRGGGHAYATWSE
jgi:response regulator of citrate/malate metabolism